MIRIWLCCVMLFAGSVAAAEVPIRAWNLLLDHPNPAVAGLLRLSLDLTVPEYGPYRLIASPPMEQGRAVKELQSGELVQIGVFAPTRSASVPCWPSMFHWQKGCWAGGCASFGRGRGAVRQHTIAGRLAAGRASHRPAQILA